MTARAGGSPANVAIGLARLGVHTSFAGRISGDPLGTFLRAQLERSDVDLALAIDASEPTTVAIVGLDEAGAAAYTFYLDGTADWQWVPAELPANVAGAAVHTGSLAIALEPERRSSRTGLRPSAPVMSSSHSTRTCARRWSSSAPDTARVSRR